jgi:hypothetical protein
MNEVNTKPILDKLTAMLESGQITRRDVDAAIDTAAFGIELKLAEIRKRYVPEREANEDVVYREVTTPRINQAEADQIRIMFNGLQPPKGAVIRFGKAVAKAKAGHVRELKGRLSPEVVASRQLQGRYLALIRQVPKSKRAAFSKMAKEHGREAAVKAMRKESV